MSVLLGPSHCSCEFHTTQALPATDLLSAQLNIPGAAFSPVIDGVELTEPPAELAAAGNFSNVVPLLLGSNENEGCLFNTYSRDVSSADIVSAIFAYFGNETAQRVLEQYPLNQFESPWELYSAVLGDYYFVCPARQTARWATAAGMSTYL